MQTTKRPLPTRIERCRQRFERWRATRNHRSRLPEFLWTSAVDLAGEFGPTKVARVLRLDYYRLKKRLMLAKPPRPAFVELLPSASTNGSMAIECIIELEDGQGAKMRIQLKGGDKPDVMALSSDFFKRVGS
jgi:hypothetical protein